MTIQRTKSPILSIRRRLVMLSLSTLALYCSQAYSLDNRLSIDLPRVSLRRSDAADSPTARRLAAFEASRKSGADAATPGVLSVDSVAGRQLYFNDTEGRGMIRLFLSVKYGEEYNSDRLTEAQSVLSECSSSEMVRNAFTGESDVPGSKYLRRLASPASKTEGDVRDRIRLFVLGVYTLYAHLIAQGAVAPEAAGGESLAHVCECLGRDQASAPWILSTVKEYMPMIAAAVAHTNATFFSGDNAYDFWQAITSFDINSIAEELKEEGKTISDAYAREVYDLIADYCVERLHQVQLKACQVFNDSPRDEKPLAVDELEGFEFDNAFL